MTFISSKLVIERIAAELTFSREKYYRSMRKVLHVCANTENPEYEETIKNNIAI